MTCFNKPGSRFLIYSLCVVLTTLLTCGPLIAAEYVLSKGQTVYVPVYSNIYTSPKKVPVHLANILSIRNTDMSHEIRVTVIEYYDTRGRIVKRYNSKTLILAPLESTHIYLSNRDDEGGVGSNFIVRWEASREVNAPIIECVMAGSEGRAFVTSGRVIKETN